MTPTLIVEGREYQIPLLDPQDQLIYAYESAQTLQNLITQKRVKYTPDGLKAWREESIHNDRMFYAIRNLLGQTHQLTDALTCYKQAYLQHLTATPEGKAVYAFCQGNPDAIVSGLDEQAMLFLGFA